jgi:hypothetical protein
MAWTDMLGNFGMNQTRGFKKTLVVGDLMSADFVTVANVYNKIGSYTVPAQQVVNIGYGNAGNPDNQGYLYVYLKAIAGTELTGAVRIAVANANETAIDVVIEEQEAVLHGDTSDRTKMIACPEITKYSVLGRSPRQDDRVQVYFKPASAVTVCLTATVVYLPVTIYQ